MRLFFIILAVFIAFVCTLSVIAALCISGRESRWEEERSYKDSNKTEETPDA